MSKATITFEDDEDGAISLAIKFTPEIDLEGEEFRESPAQTLAVWALQHATGDHGHE